jgi:hypothetical protein
VEAAAAWPPLASHLGKSIVGRGFNPVYGTLDAFLRPFEPLPLWNSEVKAVLKPRFDQAAVTSLLDRLASFVESETLVYITKTIIVGLRMVDEVLPLHLADRMTIEELSDDDVQRFGEMDLIQRPYGNPQGLYNWTGFPWLALCWTRSVPKQLIDERNYDTAAHEENSLSSEGVHEALFQSLALMKYGVAGMGGSITELAGWDFRSVTLSHPRTDTPSMLSLAVNNIELSRDEASAWPAVFGAALKRSKDDDIAIAMRRLMYAMERRRPEDRLLDAMIAAEAVFSRGSTTELSYRISLRLAVAIENASLGKRRAIFEFMRRAYGLRSKVVHGGKIKEGTLLVDGAPVSLKTFITAVEDVIRMAIRHAVMATHFSVDDLDDEILR